MTCVFMLAVPDDDEHADSVHALRWVEGSEVHIQTIGKFTQPLID